MSKQVCALCGPGLIPSPARAFPGIVTGWSHELPLSGKIKGYKTTVQAVVKSGVVLPWKDRFNLMVIMRCHRVSYLLYGVYGCEQKVPKWCTLGNAESKTPYRTISVYPWSWSGYLRSTCIPLTQLRKQKKNQMDFSITDQRPTANELVGYF